MIVLKAPQDQVLAALKAIMRDIERTYASPFFRIFRKATIPANLIAAERLRMIATLVARIDYRTIASRRMAVQTAAGPSGFFSAGKVDARNAP